MSLLDTLKLLHWGTTSYSRHLAYESLRTSLSTNLDRFVESYIGIVNNPKTLEVTIDVNHTLSSETVVEDLLIEYRNMIGSLPIEYNELVVIRDDMMENVSKTLYLLRLQ
jgi:hypothetical protein